MSRFKRGHGWQWRIKVLEQDWSVLALGAGLDYSVRRTGLASAVAVRLRFGGFLWDFFKRGVNVYPEASEGVVAPSALECDRVMRVRLLEAVSGLESRGFVLRPGGLLSLSVVKGGEFAELGNELAGRLRREGGVLKVRGFDGKVWLVYDNSRGVPELETVHPSLAQVDMDDKLGPFFEFVRVNPGCLSEITAILAVTQGQISSLARLFELHVKGER